MTRGHARSATPENNGNNCTIIVMKRSVLLIYFHLERTDSVCVCVCTVTVYLTDTRGHLKQIFLCLLLLQKQAYKSCWQPENCIPPSLSILFLLLLLPLSLLLLLVFLALTYFALNVLETNLLMILCVMCSVFCKILFSVFYHDVRNRIKVSFSFWVLTSASRKTHISALHYSFPPRNHVISLARYILFLVSMCPCYWHPY